MIPIIKNGLYQRRVSLAWWAFGVFCMVGVEMAFYPSLKANAMELNRSLAQLPSSVKALIGGSDYTSAVGYLNGRIFYLVLPMLLAIFAITLGVALLPREEDSGSMEMLLSRPVSRTTLYLAKAILLLVTTAGLTAVAFVTTAGLARLVDMDMPTSRILCASIAVWLFAICCGSLAYGLTAIGGRAKGASAGLTSFFGLGGYILASLVPSFAWLKVFARFFGFYYYRPEGILRGHTAYLPLAVLTALTLLFFTIGWQRFSRRDLG